MDIGSEKPTAPAVKAAPKQFRGTIVLSDDLKIESSSEDIVFTDGTKIITNGFKLEILAPTIQFNDTEITTFEKTKADPAVNGKFGGIVKIRAEAVGSAT